MKISVITICFNCEKTINKTVDSVIKQNFSNYEYIIIDGKSNDKTLEVLEKYKSKISRIISEKDEGLYDAINKGINNSNGDIIVLLHGNDMFASSEVLSKISNFFSKNKDIDVILSNLTIKSDLENGKKLRFYNCRNFRPWMLRIGYSPAHLSAFFKKDAMDEVGIYNNDFKIAGDFDYFVRSFLIKNLKYKYLDENLIYMSTGGISGSGLKSYINSSIEINKSLKKNGFYSNLLITFLRFPLKLIQLLVKNE